jgi:excisionase family DNA binding protein
MESSIGDSELSMSNIVTFPIVQTAFSVSEAAHYIGMSKSFLDKRRCHGGGPTFTRCGTRVRYLLADLDAWMHQNRRLNTSEAA